MASIDKRPGGKWRARWREYPGGPQKTKHFDRKVDAQNHLDGVRGDLVRGTYIDPDAGREPFRAFADRWASAQDWKQTTRESWENNRARLLPHLGEVPLASIDLLKLQAVQRKLGERYARTTVETTMRYAQMVLLAAHASGRIGRNPTIGLKPPKARAGEPDGKVRPEQVPTRAEALAILAGAPAKYRAAIALGIGGLRIGEVLGMTADRIVLDSRTVTVDRQAQTMGGHHVITTPKAEKCRTIVVPGVVAVEIRRHLRDHQGGGLLFRGERAAGFDAAPCGDVEGDVCEVAMTRDQFYRLALHPALEAAGLSTSRFKFHALRHFCASTLLADGAPLPAVAGQLGDTVETISRTYAHWLRDEHEVPATILDRVLAPAPEDQLRTSGTDD